MNKTIENYVKNCPICEKTKFTINTKIPMEISSCMITHILILWVQ